MKALGIMGGTFDPLHYGHLLAAEWARFEFKLNKIIFIPAARPPHKNNNYVSDEKHRYNMVKIAIQDNPYFEISSLEMERAGKSYTVDTINYYLENYPDTDIYFIMGADSLQLMDTWKDIDKLAVLCKYIIVTRPGYIINREDLEIKKLPPALWENLYFIQIPGLEISSSDIRKRVRENKPIKYLLPPQLEKYVYQNGLYQEKE